MLAEDWVRFATDVAPEVEWECVEDGLGHLILIASRSEPRERPVHLAMSIGQPRNSLVAESAEAIRALADDVKVLRAA